MSGANDYALATKKYVDDSASSSVDFGIRRVSFTANGSASFTVGTVANVAGKSYYVSKVTAKVTTAFVGADELVVSDGTNTLMAADEADLSEAGVYVVDLGYENATSGGATISAAIPVWWCFCISNYRCCNRNCGIQANIIRLIFLIVREPRNRLSFFTFQFYSKFDK